MVFIVAALCAALLANGHFALSPFLEQPDDVGIGRLELAPARQLKIPRGEQFDFVGMTPAAEQRVPNVNCQQIISRRVRCCVRRRSGTAIRLALRRRHILLLRGTAGENVGNVPAKLFLLQLRGPFGHEIEAGLTLAFAQAGVGNEVEQRVFDGVGVHFGEQCAAGGKVVKIIFAMRLDDGQSRREHFKRHARRISNTHAQAGEAAAVNFVQPGGADDPRMRAAQTNGGMGRAEGVNFQVRQHLLQLFQRLQAGLRGAMRFFRLENGGHGEFRRQAVGARMINSPVGAKIQWPGGEAEIAPQFFREPAAHGDDLKALLVGKFREQMMAAHRIKKRLVILDEIGALEIAGQRGERDGGVPHGGKDELVRFGVLKTRVRNHPVAIVIFAQVFPQFLFGGAAFDVNMAFVAASREAAEQVQHRGRGTAPRR